MVKIMENPIKMDDLGKTHYFRKHPYSYTSYTHIFRPILFRGKLQPPLDS